MVEGQQEIAYLLLPSVWKIGTLSLCKNNVGKKGLTSISQVIYNNILLKTQRVNEFMNS